MADSLFNQYKRRDTSSEEDKRRPYKPYQQTDGNHDTK